MPKVSYNQKPKPEKKIKKNELTCSMCTNVKKNTEFYTSYNPLHKTGRLPYCKVCLQDMCLDEKGNIDIDKTKEMLKLVDRPFLYEILKTSAEEDGHTIGLYFKNLAMTQYRHLGWKDSEFEPKVERKNPELVIKETLQSDFEVTPELIRFWGKFADYTNADYEFLQDNYESWLRECKSDTLAEKKLYKQICLQELEIQKLREQGKSVVKETESLQKLMDSANVKPKDINAANDPSNASVLGMVIKDIEQYRPAEFFENKKLYSDFDGIGDYLNRFVFRPLKNLLLGSRDYDKEFNLETSEGDSDEQS